MIGSLFDLFDLRLRSQFNHFFSFLARKNFHSALHVISRNLGFSLDCFVG